MKYYIKAIKDKDILYLHEDGKGLTPTFYHAMIFSKEVMVNAVYELNIDKYKEYELIICKEYEKDDLLYESIANYMTVNGCAATISGNRIFYSDELIEHFGVCDEWLEIHYQDIFDELNGEIVSEYQFYKEDDEFVFDLMFYGNYCNVDMEED